MGLVGLMKIGADKPVNTEALDYLDQSACELDDVIKRIVSNTNNTDDFKEIEDMFPPNEG
ncbi:MAG: hypothetical protein NVSMB24_28400 [Mucilaginibacter sp.]